jgi:hypothetical protein
MKIFREQTDPTQLNAPRKACFTQDKASGLHCTSMALSQRPNYPSILYLTAKLSSDSIPAHTIPGSRGQ